MVRYPHLKLVAADGAYAAARSLAAEASPAAALSALELLAKLQRLVSEPPRPALRGRVPRVSAGRVVEVIPGARPTSPVLVPAPGSVPGLDEARERVSVYRAEIGGRVEGRAIARGALVLVSRRRPERGEWIAFVGSRSIGIAVCGARGALELPPGARVLGMVEAFLGDGPARRCA